MNSPRDRKEKRRLMREYRRLASKGLPIFREEREEQAREAQQLGISLSEYRRLCASNC